MTETRAHPTDADFVRDTVLEIEGVRSVGANTAEEIATALNRSGYTNHRGRQWTAEEINAFLAKPEVERKRRELGYD